LPHISYFVVKQLAICAKKDNMNVGCWSLEKENGGHAKCSFSNLIDGVLPSKSIIQEALNMYDEEIDIDLNR